MVQQDDNRPSGQQNYPTTNKEEINRIVQSGEAIRAGAQQQD
jgi:hypothetical protein